jgi:uncharacterized protein (TIGR02588 family)
VTTGDDGGESGRSRCGEESGEAGEGQRRRSAAEWTTLAVSIVLILGLLALVTYVSMTGGDDLPIVEARPLSTEMRHEGESYYLPVAVANRGGRTAEEVVVQAELTGSDGTSQASDFTLDFLAGGETREGTVVFDTDPLAGELTIDVASFQSS